MPPNWATIVPEKRSFVPPTHESIAAAITEFKAAGGTIKQGPRARDPIRCEVFCKKADWNATEFPTVANMLFEAESSLEGLSPGKSKKNG